MKALRLGIFFSISLCTALVQAGDQGYSCETANITVAQADLAKSRNKQLVSVTADTEDFLQRCNNQIFPSLTTTPQTIEYYGLINQLMSAHLKTANVSACIRLGTVATSLWNSPFKTLKGSPIHHDLQKTLDNCKAKREKLLGGNFSAEPCPLFAAGHKYSSAIKAPPQWQLHPKGTACLYVYGGKNRAIPEEEGIRLRENSPYLILFSKEGEDIYEQVIDFNQGILASKDVCLSGRIDGIDLLATTGKVNNSSLRIRSYAEHCLRDSASFAIDVLYKMEAGKLVVANELSITLQP